MSVTVNDLPERVAQYRSGRLPGSRYASFDYCYNFFQGAHAKGQLASMDEEEVVVASLHLGFYLASWGMMRGSGDLLKNSVYSLRTVVQAIAREQPSTRDIDVRDREYGRKVLGLYERVAATFLPIRASRILVTKTMLGVFGCIPAFDRFFCSGFRHWTVDQRNVERIARFYDSNASTIDELEIRTLDVKTGLETDRCSPRAKIIDMYYFQKGGGSPAEV